MKLYKVGQRLRRFLVFALISCLGAGCGDPDPNPGLNPSSDHFETVPQRFPITPGIIDEASGVANSYSMSGFLWTLQDSGRPGSLYLLSTDGKSIKEFNIPGSANHDWEDLASGPGPVDGVKYLYIGDIGNNNAAALTSVIYRVPEVSSISEKFNQENLEKITFNYPDGPRDAETLLLDPLTKDIFIISKETVQAGMYRLPYPQNTSGTMMAEKVGVIPSLVFATGGSISSSGDEILIRNYISAFYWKRKSGETIGQTLLKAPDKQLVIAAEPQGEGVTFDRDGKGFYTIGEKGEAAGVSLNYYLRK